jgi:arylsulfatase A-like enzyme
MKYAIAIVFAITVSAAPPNVVFILTDDQGWNALSIPMDPKIPGSGSTWFETPHTSKLAREGMRFSMAYSPAPTCGPSRTSIQYGQSPTAVGKFAEKVPTNLPVAGDAMVQRLKAAHPTYRAAHYGKWHQRTRTPEELGYDDSDGQTMNAEGNRTTPKDPKLLFSMAKRTNAFIEEQAKAKRPFFVQVSFYANHLAYQALPETRQKYEAKQKGRTEYHNSPLWAAMNEDMDTAVGQILDKLEEMGVADNTFVIYTADNGYELKKDSGKPVSERKFYKGHPLRSHKYMISEGGLRVPFIVRGPGIPAGTSSREPVVGWDIMPTVLDMAGAADQIPAHVEGGSLLSHCTSGGKAPVKRRDPFMVFRYTKTHGALDVAIMQDGYKLMRELKSGKEHLWSLWDDLGESNNLIDKQPEKAALLRRNLDGYFARLKWEQSEHVNLPKPERRTKPKKQKKK